MVAIQSTGFDKNASLIGGGADGEVAEAAAGVRAAVQVHADSVGELTDAAEVEPIA